MIECFENKNILTIFVKFLSFKDIICLSKANKKIYTILLNSKNNPDINTIYRYFTYKQFYWNEISNDSEKTEKTDELYDDFNSTNNDWKLIYITLTNNYFNNPNNDLRKKVYDYFQNHLYLPGLRKDNKYLEFQFSSIHQIVSYDCHINNNIIYNHYDKYINENTLNNKMCNDFILKKGLPFENDLINFNEIYQTFKKDNNLINILKIIIDYDYENIDLIYVRSKNSQEKNIEIINYLLWLNHTIILFAKYIYKYLKIYETQKNNIKNDKLLLEYNNKHNDFINFSLLINDHFKNINIIINYLNKFILIKNNENNNNNSNNYFSLYKLCMNIMKKEIYEKLSNKLKDIFETECNEYIQDVFEGSTNEKGTEINDNNESKTKEDSNSFEDDDNYCDIENDDFILDENNHLTHKEIIERYMNCMADFNINEINSKLINHSELKMNEDYIKYINILINSFINKIDKTLQNKEKSFEQVFLFLKDIISIKDEDVNALSTFDGNNLNIIKRVKKQIFCHIFNHLKKYIINKIKEDFLKYIDIEMINNNNEINKNKKFIYKKNIILTEGEKKTINEQQNEKIINIYYKEIEDIKNDIINNNNLMIDYDEKDLLSKINSYFDNDITESVVILKEMMYFNVMELEYYSNLDNIIINLLSKGNNNKEYSVFIN